MFSNKRLKNLFATSTLSISDIALQTNIDYSTLTRMISGVTTNPRPETVHSLAAYFGVPVSELYDYETENELNGIDNEKAEPKSIKDILNYLLLETGLLNTTALHNASGIPKANLDRILSGKTEKPSINTMNKLANFFNISVSQLNGISPLKNKSTICQNDFNLQKKISIPVLTLTEIVAYLDDRLSPKAEYTVINSQNNTKLIAYLIDSDQLEPDFTKGTTLVVKLASNTPKFMQFIISKSEDSVFICEFHQINQNYAFIRKAGDLNIIKIPILTFKVIGVVEQEIVNIV